MLIRPEQPEDVAATRKLVAAAFLRPTTRPAS
jgi:hypothetical protein